jgi:beta-lactamase class D
MRRPFSIFAIFCLFVFQYARGFSAEENFLLINGITNEIIIEFGPNTSKRLSPCSTFKIPLSLMGYDADILKDEATPVWDFLEGYDDWLASWRAPQSPLSWMKYSCVWYSKILSLKMGLEKVQSYVASIGYGNMDMSGGLAEPGPLDPAWINSSLEISPKEQVDFIQKIVSGMLPISARAIKFTRRLLFKEKLPEGWKLFGKTGWSGSDITRDGKTLEHGWFVGWVEKGHLFFPFAYLIRDWKINLDQRIPRVKQLIEASNIDETWRD